MVRDIELLSTDNYYKVTYNLFKKKMKHLTFGDPEGLNSLTQILEVEYLEYDPR